MEPKIFERIENAKPVDFGDILSKSFNLFKTSWQEALFHALVSLIVLIPFLIIVYVPLILISMEAGRFGGSYYYDPYYNDYYSDPSMAYGVLFWIGYVVVILLLSVAIQVFTIAIAAHFYKVLQRDDTQKDIEVGGYFVYLQGNFGKILLISLATMGIALLATLLCYLPIFYVMVPLQLIVPIFAFNKELSVSDLIKAAFKLGNKYWLTVFGLIIISGLIAQLGLFLCIIGIFFTAFFVHIPMYYFYKDSIGFEDVEPPGDQVVL